MCLGVVVACSSNTLVGPSEKHQPLASRAFSGVVVVVVVLVVVLLLLLSLK
jgi:hypothetical protein